MKSTKILIILTLLLGSTISIQAQEKQNDATWEETIEFLKGNIQYMESTNKSRISNIKLDNKTLEYRINFGSDYSYFHIVQINLNKLNSVSLTSKNNIELNLIGDFVIKSGQDNEKHRQNNDWVKFDKSIRDKMLKAFKHLAYLANEKRKESKF